MFTPPPRGPSPAPPRAARKDSRQTHPAEPVRCSLDGVIGGASAYRPVEPWERGWGSPLTPVLCSNLFCPSCASPVRAVLGHALPEGLWRAIDFAGRLKPIPELLRLAPSPTVRTWMCACRAVSVNASHALAHGVHASGPSARLRLPWRCAGHLPVPAAATLDGHPLPADPVRWFAHLDALVLGEAPAPTRGRSVHDAAHPGFQLAHQLVHVSDGRLQRALGERVGFSWLTEPNPRARAVATDLYRLLPRFFGSEALAEALVAAGSEFDATPTAPGDEPLGKRLRLACAAQVARAADPAMLDAMKRDLDRDPTPRAAALDYGEVAILDALARHDPSWLRACAADLGRRRRDLSPEVRANLARIVHQPAP
jgi:hypothetical protein